MFNAVKLAAVFFGVAITLLPIRADAQCSRTWDASGEWEISQGAGGIIRLDLKQSGSAVSGTVSREVRSGRRETGKVVGDADSSTFTVQMEWASRPGELANYRGKILASGKAEGGVFYGASKTSSFSWYSLQPLTCGWNPGKSRGNLTGKPSAEDTAKPGQGVGSRLAGPVLVAGQVYFPTPNIHMGQAVLQWDAGPDHPNAELWVKYGNSRERVPFVKQSKGGQQIQVQRGLVYTYILVDGRTILATTVVVGQ